MGFYKLRAWVGTKQWGTDTLGDRWKGEGWDGEHGEEKMDMTGTFRKESRGIEGSGLGWIIGGRKDRGFGWGDDKRWW